MKVSVPKVTAKLVENRDGEVEKLVENVDKLIEKLVEKATGNGDKLTENRIAILRLIANCLRMTFSICPPQLIHTFLNQNWLSLLVLVLLRSVTILKQCEISISVVLDLTKVVSGK